MAVAIRNFKVSSFLRCLGGCAFRNGQAIVWAGPAIGPPTTLTTRTDHYDRGMGAGSAGSTSFGSLLRELRLAAGLTHEQLAQRAGLRVDAISALENGRR